MAWLVFFENQGFSINCKNIKKVELMEIPDVLIQIWFSDSPDCDFLIKAATREQGEFFKKEIEKGIKANNIRLVVKE